MTNAEREIKRMEFQIDQKQWAIHDIGVRISQINRGIARVAVAAVEKSERK